MKEGREGRREGEKEGLEEGKREKEGKDGKTG